MMPRTLYLKLVSVSLFCAVLFLAVVAAGGSSDTSSVSASAVQDTTRKKSSNPQGVVEASTGPDSVTMKVAATATGKQDTSKNRNSSRKPTPEDRLQRLDTLMRTTSPDSLPAVRAEYYRLKDSIEQARRTGGVQTGGETVPGDTLSKRNSKTAKNEKKPKDSVNVDSLKGFRPNELDTTGTNTPPEYTSSDDEGAEEASPRRKRRNSGKRSGQKKVGKQLASKRTKRLGKMVSRIPERALRRRGVAMKMPKPSPPSYTSAPPAKELRNRSTGSMGRRLVEGIALARAGRYDKAREQLAPVARSMPRHSPAGYYYARSLERTGKFSDAARHYLRVARQGRSKAYLDYFRVVGKMGGRKRARKLVIDYIRRNPRTMHIAGARRLLQTL